MVPSDGSWKIEGPCKTPDAPFIYIDIVPIEITQTEARDPPGARFQVRGQKIKDICKKTYGKYIVIIQDAPIILVTYVGGNNKDKIYHKQYCNTNHKK